MDLDAFECLFVNEKFHYFLTILQKMSKKWIVFQERTKKYKWSVLVLAIMTSVLTPSQELQSIQLNIIFGQEFNSGGFVLCDLVNLLKSAPVSMK